MLAHSCSLEGGVQVSVWVSVHRLTLQAANHAALRKYLIAFGAMVPRG